MASASDTPLARQVAGRVFLPWILFVMYIVGTMTVSFIGPWYYVDYDKVLVFLYISCFLFVCTMAYALGTQSRTPRVDVQPGEMRMSREMILVKICLVVALAVYCLLLVDGVAKYGIPSGDSLTGIMARAYTRSVSQERLGPTGALQAYQYGYFFCFVAMVLGLYRFGQLSVPYKAILVAVYIMSASHAVVFVGANKTLGDMAIIVGSVFLVRFARYSRTLRARHVLLTVALVAAALLLLSSVFLARLTLWGVEVGETCSAYLDLSHWMLRYLPPRLATGIGIVLYYPTHGYYGLSLCLRQPFDCTMGLGSSFVLMDLFRRRLGIWAATRVLTYPERVELATGYNAYANWHTIFPWLASDYTFAGAIIMLALASYAYAVSWKEAIYEENLASILMFTCLNILFVFVPANNQLAQTGTSLLASLILWFVWVCRHLRLINNHPIRQGDGSKTAAS